MTEFNLFEGNRINAKMLSDLVQNGKITTSETGEVKLTHAYGSNNTISIILQVITATFNLKD